MKPSPFEASIARIGARHPFEIDAQVILPDHLHAMWTLPADDANYSLRWALIKEAFTRAYRREQRVSGIALPEGELKVWQSGFWEHLIRDEKDFQRHLDYIHLNPVHHGYVAAPRDWQHSTFQKWVARDVNEPRWGSDERPELPDWARKHE